MTTTPVGTAGAPIGVTDDDGTEKGPQPPAFFALTSNEYVKPLIRPLTVQCDLDPSDLQDLA